MTDNTVGAGPELPPLPKSEVYRAVWDGSFGWRQYHDERDPLPETWDDEPPDEVRGFFSGDQMRDYARAALAAASTPQVPAPTLNEIRGAVARGWCHPANSRKEMDAALALAIADEVALLLRAAVAPQVPARQRRKTMELLLSDYRHAILGGEYAKAGKAYDAIMALAGEVEGKESNRG